MIVASAIAIINSLVYKPGWKFEAVSHEARFEGTVKVHVNYPAQQSERAEAPEYKTSVIAKADFPIIVSDCDIDSLLFRILSMVRDIETHEAREFLRVTPTMWAPFHPHRVDGMKRWQEYNGSPTTEDFRFGIV